jgi:hypothetical protein
MLNPKMILKADNNFLPIFSQRSSLIQKTNNLFNFGDYLII